MNFQIDNPLMQAGILRANRLAGDPELFGETRSFWAGYAKALRDLCDGTLGRLAAKDAELQQVQTGSQGAGAGLAVSVEGLLVVDERQLLTTEAAQVSMDSIAYDNINPAKQLKNSVLASVINVDDEHAAHRVCVGDGSGEHGGSVNQEVSA